MSMQPQPRHPSAYAPKPRLAGAVIQAVDQLGVAASDEIEKTADEIMRGATKIAERLRELAKVIRQDAEIASEQVADFSSKATSALQGIIALQEVLHMNGHEFEAREIHHRALSLPDFYEEGTGQA